MKNQILKEIFTPANKIHLKKYFMEGIGKTIIAVVIGLILFHIIEHHWKSGKGGHHGYDDYDPSIAGA